MRECAFQLGNVEKFACTIRYLRVFRVQFRYLRTINPRVRSNIYLEKASNSESFLTTRSGCSQGGSYKRSGEDSLEAFCALVWVAIGVESAMRECAFLFSN